MSSFFLLLLVLPCLLSQKAFLPTQTPDTLHPEATLPFPDYCRYFSYPIETHLVETQDGYILTLNRLQRKYSSIKQGLPPVLLVHGLLDSSDGAVINSEPKAPAFMLANAGFDVWSANVRGNKYSREHRTLDPDVDAAFWDFSWDEIAAIDLPAFLEHVSNVTGKETIDYIGHSQGTTALFAALADRNPVVERHLGRFVALGPVAYVYHHNSKPMKLLSDSGLLDLLSSLNMQEFSPSTWLQTKAGSVVCSVFGWICNDLLASFSDADPSRDSMDRADVFIGHFPSGTSLKNVYHWQQSTLLDAFRKFDYGTEENIRRYGQDQPPNYELGNIQRKVYLFAGNEDLLSNPVDVLRLSQELRNAELRIYPTMGHLTFMVGQEMAFMSDVIDILLNN